MVMRVSTIIKILYRLEAEWPRDANLELCADGNSLMLIDFTTMEVIRSFNIPNDGGDPGTRTGEDGREYLEIE